MVKHFFVEDDVMVEWLQKQKELKQKGGYDENI